MATPQSSDQITKSSGSNLALSFFSLPKERRDAMSSFYAFCRIADDIVDEIPLDTARARSEITSWRNEIKACAKGSPTCNLGDELTAIMEQYNAAPRLFQDILDGVEMDLNQNRYANFKELETYCYRVACAVGLVSIRIFGCTHPQTEQYARELGMAFQLTNILRDVKHDLEEYNRIYLPADEMAAFGVTEADLRSGCDTPGIQRLFRLQYFRAKRYYHRAERLIHPSDRPNLSAAWIMTGVYHSLLEKIKAGGFTQHRKPVRLNKWQKAWEVLKAMRSFGKPHTPRPLPRKVAVLGGGFSGISAALHACLNGDDVSLHESKSYWGGRSHSYTDAASGLVLDNAQHIFMGCYHESLAIVDLLGVRDRLDQQDNLSLSYLSPGGRSARLTASPLPAPFHMLEALAKCEELSCADRLSILWMGLVLRLCGKPPEEMSVEAWLRKSGQSKGAIRLLWEPLCLAALNEPLPTASASLFYEVLARSLFGGRSASAIFLNRVGMSELLMPETRLFLEACGCSVHHRHHAESIRFNKGVAEKVTFRNGETTEPDAIISALPHRALAVLLPEGDAFANTIRRIKTSPIIGAHVWTEAPITNDLITGFLDSPVQWLFNRTPKNGRPLYTVIISGAYGLAHQTPAQISRLIETELERLLPASVRLKILRCQVYRSIDATPAARPGMESLRPGCLSPWPNLYLAGDWTNTGLPGTLEGASQSGRMASEAMAQ